MPEDVCTRCGRPLAVGCSIWCRQPDPPIQLFRAAASYYAPPLRDAIHQFKYGNQPQLASVLEKYLVVAFDAPCWRPIRSTITAVVPVPADAKRLAERGYSQTELLAIEFCRARDMPLERDLLYKTRTTESQIHFNWAERQKNVVGAYAAKSALQGHHLLLIDDISTTGTTLAECAQAARDAGAMCVYGLSIAMPLQDDTTG